MLERGCNGLNVLGTTGEAMSVTPADRMRFMEDIAGVLPGGKLMAGTGAAALHDAVALTRAAFAAGFAAALVMPPFYYRDISDAGILQFFDAVFRGASPPQNGIILYNFPRMSGITFHAGLVGTLLKEFPGVICGMKDSSNDLALERELHARYPEFAILPGSEELLPEVIGEDFAGCISGSVCLWPELTAEAWANRDLAKANDVRKVRLALPAPFIAAVRARVADEQKNEAWLRSIPPLTPAG